MNSPQVIALSGWKYSGKDTVAEYLRAAHGYQPISFASLLRERVSQMYNLDMNLLTDPGKKEMPLTEYPAIITDPNTEVIQELFGDSLRNGCWTPRALMILEGSIKRAVYPNYWIRSVVNTILNNPQYKWAITDTRFLSEVDSLKILIPGIQFWRIERFDNAPATFDPSERDLDEYEFDRYISNRGNYELLYSMVDSNLETY